MKIINIKNWGLNLGNKPLTISGPCSVESPLQLMQTSIQLKRIGIKVLRAGIWKPRTRPNNFEGVGGIGLAWLKTVKEYTGMLTCVEVATPHHIEQALLSGVDILWIGSRTTTNPFSIQEIVQSLKGVDIPILVKNPICPDINLWIGAIERLSLGTSKIAAVHRGFSSVQEVHYRNTPYWDIPVELKKEIPEISVINDPSHIAGSKELIEEIILKALKLNFDGFMIESHIDPANALTDKNQQLTPDDLKKLLKKHSLL